ncbi:MAG: hypothetical protein RIC30_19415 [Marinoscillum sp.]|uniref:hypothetical protein n=1 Tax=Marinoscillum sp. TaxID=2024838 RepID=UPI0033020763
MKLLTTLLLLTFATVNYAFAQIQLKEKLSKKANQEIDKFLFGNKNKNQSDDTNDRADDEVLDTYESTDSSDPLGGYRREPVNYGTMSPSEVVGFRDLINFLPDDLGAYRIAEKPEGSTTRYGEYRYSFASKSYRNGDEELRASIFDYAQTASLLGLYANQYEHESTDGVMRSIEVNGQPGWYSANYESNDTNLALVVNGRFLITIAGYGLEEATLKGYVVGMELDQLPEAPPTPEQED